jgi:hypothetical protein
VVVLLLDGADYGAVIVLHDIGIHWELAHVGLGACTVWAFLWLVVARPSRVPPDRVWSRPSRQTHAAEVGQPVVGVAHNWCDISGLLLLWLCSADSATPSWITHEETPDIQTNICWLHRAQSFYTDPWKSSTEVHICRVKGRAVLNWFWFVSVSTKQQLHLVKPPSELQTLLFQVVGMKTDRLIRVWNEAITA